MTLAFALTLVVATIPSPSAPAPTATPVVTITPTPTILYHPADSNSDSKVVINEMTAYAAAWKQGGNWPTPPSPVPINYMTNAASLWKQGESYVYDSSQQAPLCWKKASGG